MKFRLCYIPIVSLTFSWLVMAFLGTACSKRDRDSPSDNRNQHSDNLLSQGLEISDAAMSELEKTPLADIEMQNVYVRGIWYQRFLADKEFRRIEEYDYDNLRDYPRNTVFDVALDLRDSSHFALAQVQADSLALTRKAGFHRCQLSREKLRLLILNGVNAYAAVVFEEQAP